MSLPKLTFTKDWNSSDTDAGFPTLETSEADVRADLQELHDQTKNYINNTLTTAADTAIAAKANATDLTSHTSNTSNPHSVTSSQVTATSRYTGDATTVQGQLNNDNTNINAKYTKPSSGIPSTDMTSAVQTSLGKADSAYQKPSSGIPKTDLESSVQTSLGKADTAIQDISGKMDKANPVGTGAVSINRWSETTVGNYSVAMGFSNAATDDYSVATGCACAANATSAHAEGYSTTASGRGSHSEGESTLASGGRSHAEGLGTTASGSYQHAQGKYNITDSNSKYADIVGNGTSSSSKSNAETLDWNGVLWTASDVRCGGTDQDSPTHKLSDKYEKPSTGIPETDLASAVATKLNATEVYVAQYGSSSYSDIVAAINAGKKVLVKDSYRGDVVFGEFTEYDASIGWLTFSTILPNSDDSIAYYIYLSSAGIWSRYTQNLYVKPSTGIPKTDLASAVQTSLGLADSALQSVPDLDASKITSGTFADARIASASTWNAKSTVSVSDSGTATDTVSYITIDGVEKKLPSGGSGGTSNYNELSNKPQINSVTLSGNKTSSDLGLITGITMNSASKGTSGTIDLGNVITKITATGGLQSSTSSGETSIELDSASTTALGKAHEHSNKALLDTYTQTEANLASAVSNTHTHSNKSVLDGIASSDVTAWNAKADKPQLDSIDISNTWTGSSSPYSQIVTLNDSSTLTSNSKVDLQPSSSVLAQMATDSCTALYIENNSGTLTLYAIGAGLTVAQSDVQVTITEVA